MRIASWNVNSIRARLGHVTAWLKAREPDVLLLQELKGTEFPATEFKEIGYGSVAVTQKTYNGVAVLSRFPIETVSNTLPGDEADTHARFLDTTIAGVRIINIYLPNGNPPGSTNFDYKLAWMDRLIDEMAAWKRKNVPVIIGGDFNVTPEDIDCHKPSSWMHDALFQPEPRARYRAVLSLGYTDAFRTLHRAKAANSLFGTISGKPSSITAASASITSFCRRGWPEGWYLGRLTRNRGPKKNLQITHPSSPYWGTSGLRERVVERSAEELLKQLL